MSELSEKLKGLKFMQKTSKDQKVEKNVSFSTFFCKKYVYSFISQKEDK
jgi:hypothetical protein